jgi:hypothetical protein
MRAVLAIWLALSAMCVGCYDHRFGKNEAKGKLEVIVDGPGAKSVPDVSTPADSEGDSGAK